MFPQTFSFHPEEALILIHQRQAELRKEFEPGAPAENQHKRFIQLFHLRRTLNRWLPRLNARMML